MQLFAFYIHSFILEYRLKRRIVLTDTTTSEEVYIIIRYGTKQKEYKSG